MSATVQGSENVRSSLRCLHEHERLLTLILIITSTKLEERKKERKRLNVNQASLQFLSKYCKTLKI